MGAAAANAIFGSAFNAYDNILYIDDRAYVVAGVLSEMGSVASGISPDSAIFIPYETGVKYITGNSISPTVTVIADDVTEVDRVGAGTKQGKESSLGVQLKKGWGQGLELWWDKAGSAVS